MVAVNSADPDQRPVGAAIVVKVVVKCVQVAWNCEEVVFVHLIVVKENYLVEY